MSMGPLAYKGTAHCAIAVKGDSTLSSASNLCEAPRGRGVKCVRRLWCRNGVIDREELRALLESTDSGSQYALTVNHLLPRQAPQRGPDVSMH